ncbi:C9orf72-like protein family-domain-containing protein [Halteromyces radiatus]|uniref:C9orf72-like protein family-domain-containing protein n=1 Tax=Halteromyces radiatus TaxID=101107 RepID=UPI0022208434|nr:C9orf72-like protein family-domain-containing protein [Halteromyces radiatus]KAI8081719.1 C9orf72-like protein family-domain-containing protein [Halteromyces radiatus]
MSRSYDSSSKHARLTKSKATESTTAIQPLEITTTAVVTGSGAMKPSSRSLEDRKPSLMPSSHFQSIIGTSSTPVDTLTASTSSDNNYNGKTDTSNTISDLPISSHTDNQAQTNTQYQQQEKQHHYKHGEQQKGEQYQQHQEGQDEGQQEQKEQEQEQHQQRPQLHSQPESLAESQAEQRQQQQQNESLDLHRKKSQRHHHHFIKSPVFNQGDLSASVDTAASPLVSPMVSGALSATVTTLDTAFPGLPPPIDGPSEAMAALYDVANESVKSKPNRNTTSDTLAQLFDSSFFSAILLVQWSNVVGPKVSKAWSAEPMEPSLLTTIARQVLNGEMGRTLSDIEPKWLILHQQALVCTAFLFQDPSSLSLCSLVMVVPVRYLRNFSKYFKVLSQRVPRQLIDVLVRLRKLYRRLNISWSITLDYFANVHLIPFVQSVMDLESVSLPTEWLKISHTLLARDTKPIINADFLAQIITSHLQTYGSTLLIGKNLTFMNTVINTLALFLSSEEKSRSSHARKHHKYMPDLYLQGLLLQDMEDMKIRLETALLKSPVPTTLVDLNKLQVKQTLLQPGYRQLMYQCHDVFLNRLEDDLYMYTTTGGNIKSHTESSQKRPLTLQPTKDIAPMIQSLLDETFQLPTRMREAYIRQWRRGLIKQATALVKFIEDETSAILAQSSSSPSTGTSSANMTESTVSTSSLVPSSMMDALGINSWQDFLVILTTADKLRPGMVGFVDSYSNRL